MSGRCLVFAGHRSAHKCIQQYHVTYFYKNIIKFINVHRAIQYCTFIKEENNHLAEQSTNKVTNDVHNKENSNRFMSNKIRKEILLSKKIARLYKLPKNSLLDIYKIVCQELNDQTLLTSSYCQDPESLLWEFTYHIKWPETMSFKAVNNKKIAANKAAALKCLEWLEANHTLKNGKPILYNKEQIYNMRTQKLSVASEILDSMENLIETYKMKIDVPRVNDSVVYLCNLNSAISNFEAFGPSNPDVTNFEFRNLTLKARLSERQVRHTDLPIFEFKDKILSMLEENRVLLIEGDTGCGKSTQIPQFIFDSYAYNENAVNCNILVSQPRKISAISLAKRVAYERGEIVGDVVGYQVRLENKTPQEPGRIVYCTTGIMLRKLQCTSDLKGCSHMILDEAHERSIDIDILMLLLKKVLDLNPNIKIIIMSATINSHLFQEYFNCPSIKVPGRLYPIEMNFLEDIESLPNFYHYKPYIYRNHYDNRELLIMVDLIKILQIIKWISANKPHGAILCFLPGWFEIAQIQKMLEDDPLTTEKQLILLLHAKETNDAQLNIFQKVPEDTRKIILATNIAETGITIPDVCYVVDSAIRRVVQWDETKDTVCVHNDWITQANIQQRKGRAGRVKSGISYHLIKKAEYDKLKKYPVANILSISLEETILHCKTYTDEKAEVFLSGLMEPPTPSRIQKGVDYLINIGVLDENENLTALGKRMSAFTMHPRFSKALVYSTIFNCIHPILTIVSIFSTGETGFSSMLTEQVKNRESKIIYHSSSDHIALSSIFKMWYMYNLTNPRLATRFCHKINLRRDKMKTLSMVRNLLLTHAISACLLNATDTYECENADIVGHNVVANKYEKKNELIQAVLYSATQHLVENKNIGFKKGVLRTGVNNLRIGKTKAIVSRDSVNCGRKIWPSSYLTYFRAEHYDTGQCMIVRDTSMISPLSVLLFNQQKIECHEQDDKTEIKINVNKDHTLNFSCDKRTADVLLKFKDIMWSVVQYSLEKQRVEVGHYGARLMSEYKDQLLEILVKALDASSEYKKNIKDNCDDGDNNDNDYNNDYDKNRTVKNNNV